MIKNIVKISFWDMKQRKWDFLRLCLILSVGFSALYTTLSLKGQLIAQLEEQAKYLLTSDLSISVRRAITENEKQEFYNVINRYGDHQTAREITLLSVLSSSQKSHQSLPTAVNIKWVNQFYPFYSKAKFSFSHWSQLHQGKFVFLLKDQAQRLGIKLGDDIQLLGQDFKVLDLIDDDTTIGSRFFNLFPMAFVSLNNAPSHLFGPQTSFFETLHVQWSKSLSFDKQLEIKKELEKTLTDPALRINLPKDSSEQNQKLWEIITDFLGILTLSSLILSILGLVTLMKYQWSHEIPTHLKLYLLGFNHKERFILKMFQVNGLTFFSSVMCLCFSYPMSLLLMNYLPHDLQNSMSFFHFDSFLILFCALFIVLNLVACYFFFLDKISFEQISKNTLQTKRRYKKSLFFGIIFFLFCILVGRFLTRSWLISLIVVLGLFVLYIVLVGCINLILKFCRRYFTLPHMLPFRSSFQIILRLIYRSWVSNRALYSMTVSCLGIVFFLLTLLMALQVSLKTQLSFNQDKPDLFLFDVQPEDREEIFLKLTDFKAKSLALSPMVRGRLVAINDTILTREENITHATREDEEESRFKFRAVSVSYKKELSNFERIVAGEPLPDVWSSGDVHKIPLSLEYRYAKRLKLKLGDTLTFEFQGKQFRGVIKNFRYVFWLSLHPNFFILFPDGVLNELPQTYLSVIKFPDDTIMKDFIYFMQQNFNHISLLQLKQTAELVLKQVDILLKAFLVISTLFLILGVFLWLSVVFERLSMEKGTTLLLSQLGLSQKMMQVLYLGEFMGMVVLIFLLTPLLSFSAAYLIAAEYFDGLLIWPSMGILILSIILVFPMALMTYYLVGRFTRNKI